MNTPESSNGRILKSLVAFVVLVSGVYAMMQPMSQRVDFLERQIQTMSERNLAKAIRERESVVDLGKITVRFQEVETQFSNLDERTQRIEAGARRDMAQLDKQQRERTALALRNLERELAQLDAKLYKEIQHLRRDLTRVSKGK